MSEEKPFESWYCNFKCPECKTNFWFDMDWVDPTSSTGCCKQCGSKNWGIFNMRGERIE